MKKLSFRDVIARSSAKQWHSWNLNPDLSPGGQIILARCGRLEQPSAFPLRLVISFFFFFLVASIFGRICLGPLNSLYGISTLARCSAGCTDESKTSILEEGNFFKLPPTVWWLENIILLITGCSRVYVSCSKWNPGGTPIYARYQGHRLNK